MTKQLTLCKIISKTVDIKMVYLEYDISVFFTTFVWNIFHYLHLECTQKCHTNEWLNKKKIDHQKLKKKNFQI